MLSLSSALILLGLWVSFGQSLVHFMQLKPGGKDGGCISKTGKPLPVGGMEKDPYTCGVYVCQDDNGGSLIHYCQQTAAFQECAEEGVSTVLPFPECCWICVEFEDCDGLGDSDGRRVPPGTDDDGEEPKEKSKEGEGAEPPKTGDAEPPKTGDAEPPKTEGGEPPKTEGGEPPKTEGGEPPKTEGGEPPKTEGDAPPKAGGGGEAAKEGAGGEGAKEGAGEAGASKSKRKFKLKLL